jgi:hypothetical protein
MRPGHLSDSTIILQSVALIVSPWLSRVVKFGDTWCKALLLDMKNHSGPF